MKRCTGCKKEKHADQFARKGTRRQSYCKLCQQASLREWKRQNPEKVLAQKARNRARNIGNTRNVGKEYGLGCGEYDQMIADQNGLCAICKADPAGQMYQKRLAIDHDHVTNAVRGLLCQRCNSGLGFFGDDLALLKQATEYLERYS